MVELCDDGLLELQGDCAGFPSKELPRVLSFVNDIESRFKCPSQLSQNGNLYN